MNASLWFWIGLALLLAVAATRRWLALREVRRRADPGVDDATVERILSEGRVYIPQDDPLDEEDIARAEEEFWEESWDEPEEYGR